MQKLAIFCEGQTEQIFLQKFISEIGGKKNIVFFTHKLSDKTLLRLTDRTDSRSSAKYSVLIVDCGGDEKVKSAVLDQRDKLQKSGYHLLLGLRDLYPFKLSDLKRVKSKLMYEVPTAGLPTHILLAVAEIEAWFLQEYKHYSKIKAQLDHKKFKTNFGFDPVTESAESVPAPAALLHEIYASAGLAYKKSRKHVQRTVKALDYEEIYLALPKKLPHLEELLGHIDGFLSVPSIKGPS